MGMITVHKRMWDTQSASFLPTVVYHVPCKLTQRQLVKEWLKKNFGRSQQHSVDRYWQVGTDVILMSEKVYMWYRLHGEIHA